MSDVRQRASWSGQFAFVIAGAASAIGLGNLWRFPYLAAQYGGGTFIAIYLLLVVTLGFTLMLTEIALGRQTRQSQVSAYSSLRRKWGIVGSVSTIVTFLILSYYCVIGGWVVRYFVAYFETVFCGAEPMGATVGHSETFFNAFIASPFAPFGYGMVFILACAVVVSLGVKNGIEKSNLLLMPLLFALAIALAVYVVCLSGSGEGLRYYLVPSLESLRGNDGAFSVAQLGKTVLGAMGQMFYSGSIAMGIMITYGSYMRREDSIEQSVWRIEFFDTLIALIAGLMIVPMVYLFAVKTGTPIKEAMGAGPGLMFVTLPKVFAMLGAVGPWIGMAFFALVVFAALTSAISLYETCVAAICDWLRLGRGTSSAFVCFVTLFFSTFSALGYGVWGGFRIAGMAFLDIFDFATNSVLMPVVCVATCVFVGWIVRPRTIVDEVERDGGVFMLKSPYVVLVKYVAPLFILAILVSEVCRILSIGGWAI